MHVGQPLEESEVRPFYVCLPTIFRIKRFAFEDAGITFDIPKPLTLSDCAFRILFMKFDTYSVTSPSAFPKQQINECKFGSNNDSSVYIAATPENIVHPPMALSKSKTKSVDDEKKESAATPFGDDMLSAFNEEANEEEEEEEDEDEKIEPPEEDLCPTPRMSTHSVFKFTVTEAAIILVGSGRPPTR